MTKSHTPNIAPLAALIGDPARAAMLMALMDGRALTVSELGGVAGLTKATASSHLRQLQEGGLVTARAEGRHKYIALAGSQVAALIETLMTLAQGLLPPPKVIRTGPRDPALRAARLCYDHLAGAWGVQVHDHLCRAGLLVQSDQGLALTSDGRALFASLGAELPAHRTATRTLPCRACLDWSERTFHLAGPAGRALLAALEGQGWLVRNPGQRALTVTRAGASALDRIFPPRAPG
jgi:DNA-binding transcriptional ArsR family regulator/ribosomal protein S19E (S16A)